MFTVCVKTKDEETLVIASYNKVWMPVLPMHYMWILVCPRKVCNYFESVHWKNGWDKHRQTDSDPRVFSTSFRMTPPTWRSEATLRVTGGASDPRSSTVTDRSHAAILGEREREMQETGLTEQSRQESRKGKRGESERMKEMTDLVNCQTNCQLLWKAAEDFAL